MAVTQIDLDDDALAEVMRISGERTKRGAVNYALRAVAAREGRRAAIDRLDQLAQGWDHEAWQRQRLQDRGAGG